MDNLDGDCKATTELRLNPLDECNVFLGARVQNGTAVTVLGEEGDFSYINVPRGRSGIKGYMRSEYLRPM